MADYIFLLETRLSRDQQRVIDYLQGICRQAGANLYLIGGPMRDMLAGTPIRTLDFSIEGNPFKLQKAFAKDGVELLFADENEESLRLRLHGVRFRVTAAHAETAAESGRAAAIRPGTIIEDLRRRGFTLDAIGLSLNPGSRGLLLDPTNGLSDIEARQIRAIHNYVFLEDPVRLLRAIRLQSRLGFTIEERTQARMASAKENNYLERPQRASLGRELEALAYEPEPASVLRAWDQEGLLSAAYGAAVRLDRMALDDMGRIAESLEQLEAAGISADPAPVVLECMLGRVSAKELAALNRLPLSKPLLHSWQRLAAESGKLDKQLAGKETATLAQTHAVLHHVPGEAILHVLLRSKDQRAVKKLREFVAKIPLLKQGLPLRELQQLGGRPGSTEYSNVIQSLYQQLIEGTLKTPEDLLRVLPQEAEKYGALPPPPKPTVRPPAKVAKPAAAPEVAAPAQRGKADPPAKSVTPAKAAKPAAALKAGPKTAAPSRPAPAHAPSPKKGPATKAVITAKRPSTPAKIRPAARPAPSPRPAAAKKRVAAPVSRAGKSQGVGSKKAKPTGKKK
ncbi:MAG: tRNA nucleotidyltransferase/poly(A) polymerase family protein [Terriglobales bacterium]